jgi:uncharacterized protein (TIGR02594 family)
VASCCAGETRHARSPRQGVQPDHHLLGQVARREGAEHDRNDDETPWSGTFVAICITEAGLPAAPIAVRAKAWATWGVPITPRLGCVLVFGREGGGHVGFNIGEDDTRFYVLGGNQGDKVSIAPIAKARLMASRWPVGVLSATKAVQMTSAASASTNEA